MTAEKLSGQSDNSKSKNEWIRDYLVFYIVYGYDNQYARCQDIEEREESGFWSRGWKCKEYEHEYRPSEEFYQRILPRYPALALPA